MVGYLGQELVDKIHLWAAAAGAVFVVALGYWHPALPSTKSALEQPLIIDPPGPEEFPADQAARARSGAQIRLKRQRC